MPTRLLVAITAALILLRVPSLAQPMGPDQGLYAYVGDRILQHELAYRDAWDQKPPGVHYVYAALRLISKNDVTVPAADLACAVMVAALLWLVGFRLGGAASGWLAAIVYLLLSDPSMDRYGGVRVRAQAETFIGLAVAGAVALAVGAKRANGAGAKGATGAKGAAGVVRLLVAGLLIGVAFTLKYNAGLYALVVLAALGLGGGLALMDVVVVAAGAAIVPLALLAVFWRGGALNDLYQATIVYNLRYSSETYASRLDMLRYLARFPIRHASLSPLWFVGGAGCLVLVVSGIRARLHWLPVAWVAVACVSIAINGSRELPQYFVQAAPALALAAGVGFVAMLRPAPVAARWVAAILVAVACWRVGSEPFPKKLALNVWHDTEYAAGRVDRRAHLARYGGARDSDKYSALDNIDIGWFLSQHTSPADTVYVFGFSPGSYAYAQRRSASRFFWSRPVILDFNRESSRYGVHGLFLDLDESHPAYVILQQHDWSPDVQDSAPFFLSQPTLAGWLRSNYHEVRPFIEGFSAWERNGR
jgi:4-amino-4-deoxy-L-arabinose transferase-like glycosyltransferase